MGPYCLPSSTQSKIGRSLIENRTSSLRSPPSSITSVSQHRLIGRLLPATAPRRTAGRRTGRAGNRGQPGDFSTLVAGRLETHVAETMLTVFNGADTEVDGEITLKTSEGSFEALEVSSSCGGPVSSSCSFKLAETRATFRIPKDVELTILLRTKGPVWIGWAELKSEACARSVLRLASIPDDSSGVTINYLIPNNLVAEVELFPTHRSKKYAFPVEGYISRDRYFWTAYAIVNTASTTAKVQLTGEDSPPFLAELAAGERITQYASFPLNATFPAVGAGRVKLESDQPVSITVMKTSHGIPFLSIPVVEYPDTAP